MAAIREHTSRFLQRLLETPDIASGNLLDNTFVPYVTEVARADHSFGDGPFVVFGGSGVGFVGNRLKKYSPRRPLNDLWLTARKRSTSKASTASARPTCTPARSTS